MSEIEKVGITICGDGGTGKSSLTLRLVRSQWTAEYDPTIEDSYSITREIDGRPVLLSLTDTAGQEEYRGLWTNATRSSDAFLLVYDITSPPTLYEHLPYFLDMINMEKDAREESGKVQPVIVIAGNKCDLRAERKISAKDGLTWARERGCGFMETSARECVNVEETFALIIRRVLNARQGLPIQTPLIGTATHSPSLSHVQTPTSPIAGGFNFPRPLDTLPPKPSSPRTNTFAIPNRPIINTSTSAPGTEPGVYNATQPLTPMNEKSGFDDDNDESKVKMFFAKLKCW